LEIELFVLFLSHQTNGNTNNLKINKMKTLTNTKENDAKVKALKVIQNTIGKIYWVGNITHNNLDNCLRALNNESCNSGWYNPVAVRIVGLTGIYMVNQDGSLFCEARVIKQEENKYLIEYLSNEGWDKFEDLYCQFIEE
jgi:hypothetical protein